MARLRFGDGRDWFLDRRFGLFVHWGLYAVGGWHEQEMWRRNVPRDRYVQYAKKFNPVGFDPDAWLDLAEEAGMEYICVTTKHHDGFCLWDTAQTDFNVMNTPYGKDVIGMLADACHRRGFPLCLYYSIADWHHPNYPNQGRHHEMPGPFPGDEPNLAKYLEFLRAQVRELCTRYGEIHGIWWDMNVSAYEDYGINLMIRKLQPKAVINNRGFDPGDFSTPERDHKKEAVAKLRRFRKRTEACQAVGMNSWGYKVDEDYYDSKYLMQSIARMIAMGANYLLNVGPKPDGTIDERSASLLREVGAWYRKVKEAYGQAAPASELIGNRDVFLTQKENALYAHFVQDPPGSGVVLDKLSLMPDRVTLLNDGRELAARRDQGVRPWTLDPEYVRLRNLPVEEFRDEVMVVKMEFDPLPKEWLALIADPLRADGDEGNFGAPGGAGVTLGGV